MNFLPDFSHIYVESQSIDSDIAEQSFKRFPKAKIIEIEDYKKIFNKNGQDFQIQKLSTKLISCQEFTDMGKNKPIVPKIIKAIKP